MKIKIDLEIRNRERLIKKMRNKCDSKICSLSLSSGLIDGKLLHVVNLSNVWVYAGEQF